MRGEALAIGPVGFDLKQLLTTVIGGYLLLIAGIYLQAIIRPLISWTVLFNGRTDQRAPEMWQTMWQDEQISPASLVVLEIKGSGFSDTAVASWQVPLSFAFEGRKVIHFKVRDSSNYRSLIKPPPYDPDTSPEQRAKVDGDKIELPKIPLKRKAKFKLLVLLEGTDTGVEAGGMLRAGAFVCGRLGVLSFN